MYLQIFFILTFSSLTIGFFGRFFGKFFTVFLCLAGILLYTPLFTYIYVETVVVGFIYNIEVSSWVDLDIGGMDFNILFDPTFSFMLLIISTVSFCVRFLEVINI